ncbi:MAG: glutamate 5-kinase [Myxococcota bacterium]
MRLVVKLGSRILAEDPAARVAALAEEIEGARAGGHTVVVVTSGAIALGMERLGLRERPRAIPTLQAAAAVGQCRLMEIYARAFEARGLAVGQVLLTHADVAERARFLNARHALKAMLALGAVPVINENDTVAVDEIKFGDNDRLAALVASVVDADRLLLLTDVEGLLDAGGRVMREVDDPEAVAGLAGGASGDGPGTGGMASKVEAARIAGRSGVETIVASGRTPGAMAAVLLGATIGTRFRASVGTLAARKHWIAYVRRPEGGLVVDDGARRALVDGKRSLLASGITEVRGDFDVGAAVSVIDREGREFARGLAGYGSAEIARILGRRSGEIEDVLGYKYFDEVVHRDDLVLL